MYTDQQIAEKVASILVEAFELEEEDLTPDATLFEKLGLDSLDSVDLVIALEKSFDFKIDREKDEKKFAKIRLLQDVYDFIREKTEDSA